VAIEGVLVLDDWEPWDASPRYAAYDFDILSPYVATVADGSLDIVFTASQDNAKISGIEAVPLAIPTATNTAGPSPTPTPTPVPGTVPLLSTGTAVLSPSSLLDSAVRTTYTVAVPVPAAGWAAVESATFAVDFTGNTLDFLECVDVYGGWADPLGGRGACNFTPFTSLSSVAVVLRCVREPVICAAFADGTEGGVIRVRHLSGGAALASVDAFRVTLRQASGGATVTPVPPTATRTPTATLTPTRTATPGGASPTPTWTPSPQPGGQQLTLTGGQCTPAGLQSAINALVTGGRLTLSCGGLITMGNAAVQLANKQNVTVRGDAPVVHNGTANEGFRGTVPTGQFVDVVSGPRLLVVWNCDGCVVEDLEVHGGATLGLGAVGVQDSDDFTFQRNWVHLVGRQGIDNTGQTGGGAIGIGRNRRGQYLNNIVEDTGGDQCSPNCPHYVNTTNPEGPIRGLWVGNQNPNVWEHDTTINGNTFNRTASSGIVCCGGKGNKILNNTIRDTRFGGMKVGVLDDTAGGNPTVIEGNVIQRAGSEGGHSIQVSSGNRNTLDPHTMIIRNNHLEGTNTYSTGIYLDDTPQDNVLIEHNLIENFVVGNGIEAFSLTNVTIRNNIIRNNAFAGVSLWGLYQSINLAYSGVVIHCNTVSGNGVHGLLIQGGGVHQGTQVTHNAFTSNTGWGLISGAGTYNSPVSNNNAYSGNSSGGASGPFPGGAGTPAGCGTIGRLS
jgi:parallel beta-helix repeat protein